MNLTTSEPQVRRAGDLDATGEPGALDRYLIESADSGGALAVVEHTLAPGVLAAPVHRHSREDEYSIVLEGRLGVFEDGVEVYATAGDVVFKRRGRWHTFWNAGEEPLRVLELISPGGIEALFRKLAEPGGEYDPASLPALAAEYGGQVDFDATVPILERHGLRFAERSSD
jgi:mannose-6-phosphate isomerase-like protein (cupin superfamily)